MGLEHKIEEREKYHERHETYSSDIGEWHVYLSIEEGHASMGMMPKELQNYVRLPTLTVHPRRVSDLPRLARALVEVLDAFASELTTAGLDDLRASWDRYEEEQEAQAKWLHDALGRKDSTTKLNIDASNPDAKTAFNTE